MKMLDSDQAAKFLFGPTGKKQTLEQWRFRNTGPKYRKLGKFVRYAEEDLLEYLEQQVYTGTGGSHRAQTY